MLEARNIYVAYDTRQALADVSLELRDGEIIALLGANGAGKTTLVRALNGSVPISDGEIAIDEKPLAEISRREIAKHLTVVAQENETRFPITVLEFILSGRFAHGSAFGWETDTDRAFAQKALGDCDLSEFESRLMNSLSGGERQRVVLARALATGARILLLDEPTANLDLAHQALMFRNVRAKCSGDGMAAVVITHDLNLASEFADEIMMMKNGNIIARGNPANVLTSSNIKEVFGVSVLLDENPASGNVRVTAVY